MWCCFFQQICFLPNDISDNPDDNPDGKCDDNSDDGDGDIDDVAGYDGLLRVYWVYWMIKPWQ